MRYRAIGAAALFAETNLRDDEVVQFRCLDGFVASISKERIMRNGPANRLLMLRLKIQNQMARPAAETALRICGTFLSGVAET